MGYDDQSNDGCDTDVDKVPKRKVEVIFLNISPLMIETQRIGRN